MKTLTLVRKQCGSVLLTTLVITGILGFTLASYLTLVANQNRSVWRSQTWNSSIPVAEAGVEEAMAHLNKNCLWSDITRSVPDWTNDNWTNAANGFQKTVWLGSNYYVVTIITNTPYSEFRPAIVAEGYVPSILATKATETMLAAIGTTTGSTTTTTANTTSSGTSYSGRKVRATTARDGIFAKAMVAKQSIDLKGNNVATDSFDSMDPSYSTLGQYDPNPLKTKDNGDVAVNMGLVNTLSIGNANISGHIATGPGGSISIGPNGKVGNKAWLADPTTSGIQTGRSRDDMNVSFPDVKIPFTGGYSTPGPLTVTNPVLSTVKVTNTSSTVPSGPGTLYTNTVTTTSASYPNSGSYLGSVNTNTIYTTASGSPASGTYIGLIVTNTTSTISTTIPSSGTYIGNIATNTVGVTTTNVPPSGTYLGNVSTNTTYIRNASQYPQAGTYVGNVTTNFTGQGVIKNYNYYQIVSYSYNKITGYTYERFSSYSFWRISTYTYALIANYSLVRTDTVTNSYEVINYDYYLDSGNFQLSAFSGKVLVTGNAILHVTDDVDFTGTDRILILPGASLKLYVSAPSAKLTGQGVINQGGNATNFYYYGTTNNTSLAMGGNGEFTGVIYAPQADFSLGGGGTSVTDFIGASVTKTVHMNGHFKFHYDEALNRHGPARGFVIESWDEIKLTDAY